MAFKSPVTTHSHFRTNLKGSYKFPVYRIGMKKLEREKKKEKTIW